MKTRSLRSTLSTLLAFLVLATAGLVSAQAGPVIYAIINEQDAQALADLFEEQTGMKPTLLRGSTGEIIARVLAEQANPQADVVLGGPSTLHITLAQEGALEPHELPAGLSLPEGSFDSDGLWTGFHTTALGVGVNLNRYASRYGDRPMPETWEDLLDPVFAGEIVVTDPLASSTAYLFVQVQLQRLGWEAGWDYLSRLVPLVGQFPSSGSAPTQLVSQGEYTLGVSYIHALARNVEAGLPIAIIVPPDTGGEIGAVSVIGGGPNPDAAHAFVDFILGADAQQLFTDRSLTSPLNPDVVLPSGTVSAEDISLIDFDPDVAAEQREAVLEQWGQLID